MLMVDRFESEISETQTTARVGLLVSYVLGPWWQMEDHSSGEMARFGQNELDTVYRGTRSKFHNI
jgi:hypothetical protein